VSDLKYTITKYDAENKILDVVFSDNGWASIHLREPLPTNKEELEKIIKQFASPIEVIQAREDTSVDLSYIAPLVGTQYTTTRFSVTNPDATMSGPTTGQPTLPTPEQMQQYQEFQKLQAHKQIGDFLVQQGLLQTNPITPEILDAARPTPPEATQAQPITQGMQEL
jgi:hypothetical protein